MSHFVKEIDYCGSIVGIMYNGNRRYKSLIGGILTMIAISGILAVAVYYFNIFFSQKTAKMSLENIKYYEPPNLNISKDFIFAVMMQYHGINTFMNDKVKVDAFYVKTESKKTQQEKVSSVPCVQADYQNDSLYKSLELNKAVCFNISGIELEGANVNNVFSYFQIRFLLCIDDGNCYPKEHLNTFFQDNKPLAIVYFLDSTFQINNKKERCKTFINSVDVNITYNNAKSTNIYFSKNKMKVDDNYFFSTSPKINERFMIDTFRDLVSVRTEEQTEALIINFMSSKNEQIINITYMQLSELLANIGALVNVIILFLSSIGNFINHYYFQSDLMNALYTFDTNNRKKKNMFSFNQIHNVISLKECSKESIIEICDDRKDGHLGNDNNKSNEELKSDENNNDKEMHHNATQKHKQKQSLKLKNNMINCSSFNKSNTSTNDKSFSYWDITVISLRMLIPFLKCKDITEKTKRFKLIEQSMSSFQDFITVFKKLQEIDLIKYLFLTDEQLNMYEIMPKPEWNNPPNQPFSQLYHQKGFHFLKSLKEINLSLRKKSTKRNLFNFITKGNKSSIDEKLINLIKSRLSKFD